MRSLRSSVFSGGLNGDTASDAFLIKLLPLTVENYRDTLKDTWEKRYNKAVEKYPASRYIYDAVDLLQQFDLPLYRFTVEATARMLAPGNLWRRLWSYWQIRNAINYLISAERILEPRDGQIEAKPKQVEAGEYTLRFTRLILQLAEKHQEIQTSLLSFSWNLINLKRYQEALRCLNKALTFTPDSSSLWVAKGYTLDDLGRLEKAIASYDQALKIKPDYHQAWNNRGNALRKLKRLKQAIASYDKALKIKPDYHQAWNNQGIALFNLVRLEQAIASYDKALEIKPDYHEAWYNRGIALVNLRRLEKAIASYDKALEIKPDDHEAWYNKACCYSLLGNIDLAIDNLQQAINLNPECREIAKTDPNFGNIRQYQHFQDLISH